VSLKTALISGAAGGINEMIIFGMSADANVAVIAFVQLFRVVTFLVLIPYLSMLGEKIGRKRQDPMPIGGSDKKIAAFSALDYVPLAAFALLGSALGTALRVPTGAMLGAMLAGGIFSIAIDKKYRYDTRIRFVAQIGLGLALGQRMSPEIVSQLGTTFIPAIAVTAIMLVGSTLLAFLLHKTTGWDIVTCLLCSAPAGLSQITVFAEEIGADSLTASVFHTVRIIGIVSLYPWIIMPLAG
jgi:membrane AbrB-like protein